MHCHFLIYSRRLHHWMAVLKKTTCQQTNKHRCREGLDSGTAGFCAAWWCSRLIIYSKGASVIIIIQSASLINDTAKEFKECLPVLGSHAAKKQHLIKQGQGIILQICIPPKLCFILAEKNRFIEVKGI